MATDNFTSHVDKLMERYCFYRQKYVMMAPKFTKHMKTKYGERQVWEHLNGNFALCVFAGPSNTSFLSIDIDYKDPNIVHAVVDTMTELGIPRDKIYVSTSGGKGYHADIFFSNSIYNWKAKELYDLIIFFGGFEKRKIEYRPNAKNAIKIPLGIHSKTGRRCWFVDRETLEPIEDPGYIEQTEVIDTALLDDVIKAGNKRRFNMLIDDIQRNESGDKKKKQKSVSSDLYDITEPGTRHSKMIEVALALYREGGDYGSIYHDLVDWLNRQNPRMIKGTRDECMRDAANIAGWVMQKGRRNGLGDDPNHDWHKKTRIYRSDAMRIIKGKTKTARMLAFLFTVYCDKYGYCGMGEWKLCQELGVKSNQTVVNAAKDLVEKRLFYKKQGGAVFTGVAYKCVTNKYSFPMDYKREGEYLEIDELIDHGNVYDMYIQAIAALCSPDELKAYLTKDEMGDCRRAAKSEDADAGRSA